MGKVHNIKKPAKEKTCELTIERLLSPEFSEAIKTLQKIPMKPVAAMKVKKATMIIYNSAKNYVANRTKVFEKYCEKDENGGLVYEDEGKTMYKVPEDKRDDCYKELEGFYNAKMEVPVVYLSAFYGDPLTPEFLGILDGIVLEDLQA